MLFDIDLAVLCLMFETKTNIYSNMKNIAMLLLKCSAYFNVMFKLKTRLSSQLM